MRRSHWEPAAEAGQTEVLPSDFQVSDASLQQPPPLQDQTLVKINIY